MARDSRYGVWCAHGQHILVADPEDTESMFPAYVISDPWPCDAPGCTEAAFLEDCELEAGRRAIAEWEVWREMQG